LHIAQKLSELIGATITVTSTPGTGSTFVVSLAAEAT
jgi:signal transduction histidine kinase